MVRRRLPTAPTPPPVCYVRTLTATKPGGEQVATISVLGRVESLWRYPVKSMRGEELQEVFVGFGGVFGDRLYAIHNSGAKEDFPYLTAREQSDMLLCRPVHRSVERIALDVQTRTGETFAINDERLLQLLGRDLREGHELTLLHSEKAIADCHPVSILSVQSVEQLSVELGRAVDKRRFRANIYLDLATKRGFAEDEFVGRTLRIGAEVVVHVLKRDQRCKMITLDPDTAEPDGEIMRLVASGHESRVGIYADVLAEGTVRRGDSVTLFD